MDPNEIKKKNWDVIKVSRELNGDLKAIHGIDIEKDMLEALGQEDENETFGYADYLETDEPIEPIDLKVSKEIDEFAGSGI
jgi:hypothetical protein